MKLVYEATNAIEAHMILNLLEQAGLSGRVDGEHLQGGVGEIQTMGLARVMVDDDDYAQAKEIVDEWDAQQPEPLDTQVVVKKTSFSGVFVGFILGVAFMSVLCNFMAH